MPSRTHLNLDGVCKGEAYSILLDVSSTFHAISNGLSVQWKFWKQQVWDFISKRYPVVI